MLLFWGKRLSVCLWTHNHAHPRATPLAVSPAAGSREIACRPLAAVLAISSCLKWFYRRPALPRHPEKPVTGGCHLCHRPYDFSENSKARHQCHPDLRGVWKAWCPQPELFREKVQFSRFLNPFQRPHFTNLPLAL